MITLKSQFKRTNVISTVNILFLSTLLFLPMAKAQSKNNTQPQERASLTDTDIKNTEMPPGTENNNVEKIEVTGSYIKRIDIEGPSPLRILNREMFDTTGSMSVSDLLKEEPWFELVYEDSGYVRFHGQHGGNVLVLLNGINIPKRNGGFYTSLRTLPSSVIERVEILKEGISSLYGSDAMSGVINFITRSDVQGGNVTSSFTLPEIGVGQRQRYTATYGKSWNRGNVLGMVQMEKSHPVDEYDLGSYNTKDNVVSYPVSRGKFSQGANHLSLGQNCGSSTCESDHLQFNQTQDAVENFNTFFTGTYSFDDDVRFSALGMYNRKTEQIIDSPLELNWVTKSSLGDQSLNPRFISPNSNLSKLRQKGFDFSSEPLELQYQLAEEVGPQIKDNLEESYNVQGTLEGSLGDLWTWKVQSGFSVLSSESHMVSGNANQVVLRHMAHEGGFDPTLPFGDKSDVSAALVSPTYRTSTQLFTTRALATGELGSWGTGPLSMSVGVDSQLASFKIENDEILTSPDLLTAPVKNFSGHRDIYSTFMELISYPFQDLEIQLAGRFDRYSDLGSTWNPKLALSYKPHAQWLFRSSAGTGFRAPGMTDLYRGHIQELDFFVDQLKCDQMSDCGKDFYQLNTFVTSHLSPETSLHYNLGVFFQPAKNLSFTVDQWNFLGKDTIARIYPNEYTELESRGYNSQLTNLGVVIDRDPETGELLSITTPHLINMGKKVLRGADISAQWGYPLFKSARLGIKTAHSFIFDRRTRTFDFEGMESFDNSWKNTTSVSLAMDNHYGRMAARTVSSNLAGKRRNAPQLPQTTMFDINYSYTAPWSGKLSLGIKNLLDTRPPVDETGRLISYGKLSRQNTAFSALGRRYFLSYSQSF